jgi:hypothetical protein
VLTAQAHAVIQVVAGVQETEVANARYAPGKWTLKEVFGQIDDRRGARRRAPGSLPRLARGMLRPTTSGHSSANSETST